MSKRARKRRHQILVDSLIEAGYEGDADAFAKKLKQALTARGHWVGPAPEKKIRPFPAGNWREWL